MIVSIVLLLQLTCACILSIFLNVESSTSFQFIYTTNFQPCIYHMFINFQSGVKHILMKLLFVCILLWPKLVFLMPNYHGNWILVSVFANNVQTNNIFLPYCSYDSIPQHCLNRLLMLSMWRPLRMFTNVLDNWYG